MQCKGSFDLNGGPPFDRGTAVPLPAGADTPFAPLLTIYARQALLSTAANPQPHKGSITRSATTVNSPRVGAKTVKHQGEKTHWAWIHNRLHRCGGLAGLRLRLLWLAGAACRAAGLLQCHTSRCTICLLIGPAESVPGQPASPWESSTRHKAYRDAQVALPRSICTRYLSTSAHATDQPKCLGLLMGSWQPGE